LYVINAYKTIDDDKMNLTGIFGMLGENKKNYVWLEFKHLDFMDMN